MFLTPHIIVIAMPVSHPVLRSVINDRITYVNYYSFWAVGGDVIDLIPYAEPRRESVCVHAFVLEFRAREGIEPPSFGL